MSSSTSNSQLVDRLLGFAWNQWAQLGVAAHVEYRDQRAADPEALLAFTLEVARRDPRLFDEVLDWVRLNGSLLSRQRLHNVGKHFGVDGNLVMAVLAWSGARNRTLPWGRALKSEPELEREATQLFIGEAGPLLGTGHPDPMFLRYGYGRPHAEPSQKSIQPILRRPACLAFRLRHLFGVGARSEVLRYLLARPERDWTAYEVARAAQYAKRNVHEALASLESAGVLIGYRRANERVFSVRRKDWADFLLIPSGDWPEFADWVRLLRVALEFLRWRESDQASPATDYMQESRTRELLETLTPDLVPVGVRGETLKGVRGTAFHEGFEGLIDDVLGLLEGSRRKPEAAVPVEDIGAQGPTP